MFSYTIVPMWEFLLCVIFEWGGGGGTRRLLGHWASATCSLRLSSVAKSCFVCLWEQWWDRKRNSMKLPPDWIMHASICWQRTSLSGLLSVNTHKHTHTRTHTQIHTTHFTPSIVHQASASITNAIPQVNCATHFTLLHWLESKHEACICIPSCIPQSPHTVNCTSMAHQAHISKRSFAGIKCIFFLFYQWQRNALMTWRLLVQLLGKHNWSNS